MERENPKTKYGMGQGYLATKIKKHRSGRKFGTEGENELRKGKEATGALTNDVRSRTVGGMGERYGD